MDGPASGRAQAELPAKSDHMRKASLKGNEKLQPRLAGSASSSQGQTAHESHAASQQLEGKNTEHAEVIKQRRPSLRAGLGHLPSPEGASPWEDSLWCLLASHLQNIDGSPVVQSLQGRREFFNMHI